MCVQSLPGSTAFAFRLWVAQVPPLAFSDGADKDFGGDME